MNNSDHDIFDILDFGNGVTKILQKTLRIAIVGLQLRDAYMDAPRELQHVKVPMTVGHGFTNLNKQAVR